MIPSENDKEVLATSGKAWLYSQIFKPITATRRQVTMRAIACTMEGVDMIISINMGGNAEVKCVKSMVLWILYGFKDHMNVCRGLKSSRW